MSSVFGPELATMRAGDPAAASRMNLTGFHVRTQSRNPGSLLGFFIGTLLFWEIQNEPDPEFAALARTPQEPFINLMALERESIWGRIG